MRHPYGLLGWVDLTTTDIDAARASYTGLFGWQPQDVPTSMGPAYTMLRKDGRLVAGMGPQPPAMAGAPPVWNS